MNVSRKIICVFMIFVLIFSFSACKEDENKRETEPNISSKTFNVTDDTSVESSALKNSIDLNLGVLNTSVSDLLEEYSYIGENYLSDWESSYFTSKDRRIYNLNLTGTEKNYYIYNQYITITTRGDTIVGISQSGFQSSDIDNTYQLLNWLGGNAAKLIDYEPEIIYTDKYLAYLKWEVNNGYLVIYTSWYQGLTDWKESTAWGYCMFIK